MTVNETLIKPPAPPPKVSASPRAALKRFAITSAFFLTGLLIAVKALDLAIGSYLHKTAQRGGLGGEVQTALDTVDKTAPHIHVILLGDSVARQLFTPGQEPGRDVRFLTTNQAISAAGQCYLADEALRHCPNLQDVYLLYLPAAWENNLPRELSRDYFCGHFHHLSQVIEVFKVKRDVELSFAHLGRWMCPNIMAANSLSRPAVALLPGAKPAGDIKPATPASPPPDPERLVTEFSAWIAPRPAPVTPEPYGERAIVLSPVSRYYLAKLRKDCRQRGVRLHVIPCPVSDEKNHIKFVDADGIYEGPIIGDFPADQLIDSVHFKPPYIQAARERVIREYGLKFLPISSDVSKE